MDKMKKIASLLEKLEVTPEEAVIDWVRNGLIDLKSIQTALEQKRKETVFIASRQEVEPGMFLYANGKISATYTEGQCKALVLDVYSNRGTMLMMCLQKSVLPFCAQNSQIDTNGLNSGLNVTHFIKQMAEDVGDKSIEAALYCLNYEDAFVVASQAFMMTVNEAKSLEPNAGKISSALHTAGISDGFWLSTTVVADKEGGPLSAQIAVFMPDRVALQKEYVTIPQAVYPVYELKFSRLDL